MGRIIEYIADLLWDWPLIVTILSTGIYFTLSCRFFQIKYFRHICKSTFGSLNEGRTDRGKAMTGVETFVTAIATTSGVGNITGVATAIAIGGPGALLWMLMTGLIGMIIKMAEVTLAVYYRDEKADGSFESGPMHYMEKGIGLSMNFGSMWLPIAVFSIGIMSTLFITIQNSYASSALSNSFNIPIIGVASVYAIVLYVAIYKGINKVSKVFKVVIPFVVVIYISSGILVLLNNAHLIISAIKWILSDAFNMGAIFGGVAGGSMGEVIRQGVSRAVYSNEAGWGTTPMIHAKAATDHPVKLGFWGAIEVFFDTVVICSISGLVMVIALMLGVEGTPYEMMKQSFETGIGPLVQVVLPMTIFLFGLTTSFGWYAYYETILNFIETRSHIKVSGVKKVLKIIYPLPGFVMVYYVHQIGTPNRLLWAVSDLMAGLPTFVNIFVVLILSNKFFDLLKDYETRFIHKQSVDDPVAVFFKDEDDEVFWESV